MTTTPTAPTRRPAVRLSASARRAGYLIATACSVALIWLVNVAPGWRWVPYLTDDFTAVLGLVNLSLVAGAVANIVYVLADPRWLRRLGDALTAAISAVVLLQLATVFPFDLSGLWSWADTLLSVVLVVCCVATFIAALVNLVQAVRLLAGGLREHAPGA